MELKPSSHAVFEIGWRVADWIVQLHGGAVPTTRRDARPLGATSVLRAHGVLAGILDRAVADRRLQANPARGVPLPHKVKKVDRHHLTHQQVDPPADEAKAMAPLVRLLAYTGLRWGEAVELRVGDIDLVRSRVHVHVHVRQDAPRVGGKPVTGTPKSHEARSVPLPDFLRDDVATLCENRPLWAFVFGEGLVPLSVPTWKDGWYVMAKRRAHVRDALFPLPLTIHDVRHTAASLAISSGANVRAVQRMLGHASAAMTLDTYADLFDDDLAAVAASLSDGRRQALSKRQWEKCGQT